jgi:hypothetical protein
VKNHAGLSGDVRRITTSAQFEINRIFSCFRSIPDSPIRPKEALFHYFSRHFAARPQTFYLSKSFLPMRRLFA